MWKAISGFLQEFVAIFYRSDEDVSKDNELQACFKGFYFVEPEKIVEYNILEWNK